MTHCFSQSPSSLSDRDGSLQHTNKTAVFYYLQVKFPDIKIKILQNTAVILDGIAIIQQLANHIPAMFNGLSIFIFRVDYTYHIQSHLSIKDTER